MNVPDEILPLKISKALDFEDVPSELIESRSKALVKFLNGPKTIKTIEIPCRKTNSSNFFKQKLL